MYAFVNIEDRIKGAMDPAIPFLAGKIDLYFGKDTWYVWVGTPKVPVALKFGDNLQLTSYLDIGKKMPEPAELSPKIREVLNLDANFKPTAESSRASGAGFAFGAAFDFSGSGSKWGVAWDYAVGAGFDVMINKYGKDVICTNTNQPIGVNGWYAIGQLYAYVTAKVSAASVDLLDCSFGSILVLKGPKPLYGFAKATAKYTNWAGVKKEKEVEIEFGEQCEFNQNSNPAKDMEIISEITPGDEAQDVSPLVAPTVSFNMPIDVYQNLSFNGKEESYRANLNYVSVLTPSGEYKSYEYDWNSDKTQLTLKLKQPLPPNTRVTIKAEVSFYKGTDLLKIPELKTITFAVGEMPTNIPKDNILAAYPADGMLNFYPKQDSKEKGYIKLKVDQANVFKQADRKFAVSIHRKGTSPLIVPVSYNSAETRIEFPLKNLEAAKIYEIKLLSAPKGSDTYIKLTTPLTSAALNSSFDPGEVLNNPPASAQSSSTPASAALADTGEDVDPPVGPNKPEDEVLTEIYFRVSKYKTLKEKLDVLKNDASIEFENDGRINIRLNTIATECFEGTEFGTPGKPGFIQCYGDILNNAWFKNEIRPQFYNSLPISYSVTSKYYPTGSQSSGATAYDKTDTYNEPTYGINYNNIASELDNGQMIKVQSAVIGVKVAKENYLSGKVPDIWLYNTTTITYLGFNQIFKDMQYMKDVIQKHSPKLNGKLPYIYSNPLYFKPENISKVGKIPIGFNYRNAVTNQPMADMTIQF